MLDRGLLPWLLAAMLLSLCACTDPEEGDDDDDDDVVMDGFEVEAVVSELVATVVTVRFTGDVDPVDEAYVEFGASADYGFRAPAALNADDQYEAMLVGIPASTEMHYRVGMVSGGEAVEGEDRTITNGPLPSDMHGLSVQVFDEQRVHEGFVVTSMVTDPSWVVILDTAGNVVWWYHEDRVEQSGRSISRVRLSRDREAIVFLSMDGLGTETEDIGKHLTRIRLDGSELVDIDTPDTHNDFVELPEGGYAILQEDMRTVEGDDVFGDHLVEIAPDGTETEIWSVWDHIEYDPEETEYGMWSHANAVDYDEDEGIYYVGSRNLSTIFKIDRATGDVEWTFGDLHGDFDMVVPSDHYNLYQHQFQILDDGILIFDNRFDPVEGSRAVQFELDTDTMEARQAWEYIAAPPLFCVGLGDVTRFDNGDTMVIWSSGGQLDQVGPDGELLYQLNLDLGAAMGYGIFLESLYE